MLCRSRGTQLLSWRPVTPLLVTCPHGPHALCGHGHVESCLVTFGLFMRVRVTGAAPTKVLAHPDELIAG